MVLGRLSKNVIYKLVIVTAAMIWIGGSNKLVTACVYKNNIGDRISVHVPYKSYCKPEITLKN
jgi:hypothetical protein